MAKGIFQIVKDIVSCEPTDEYKKHQSESDRVSVRLRALQIKTRPLEENRT